MKWVKDDEYLNTYYCKKEFNGCTYVVVIWVEELAKSIRFWVGASSGKKRDELEIFEEKDVKNSNGLKPILWIRDAIFDFPEYWNDKYIKDRKHYICIHWADSRRRDIYSRLENYGFRFMTIDRVKILMKKL